MELMRWGNDFTSGRGVNAMLNTQFGDHDKLILLGDVGWRAGMVRHTVVLKNPNKIIRISFEMLTRFVKCNF